GEGKALRVAAKPRAGIPIYLATLSPRSLEMTGEVADGWLGTSFMPEHAHVFLDHLATGAKRAGRALDALDLHVSAGVLAFGDDLEKLIPPRKPGLAFSLGAMGSRRHNFYNDAYRRAGYAEVATDVQRLWLEATLPSDLRDKVLSYGELTKDELLGWHKTLAKKGWIAPHWPREWGGIDWTVVQRYIFEEECGAAGCPPIVPFGVRMCAPVL